MNTPEETTLATADAEAVVHLLGKLCFLQEEDCWARKRFFMEEFCHLIGAQAWAWSLGPLDPTVPAGQVVCLQGGMGERTFNLYLRALSAPDAPAILAACREETALDGSTPVPIKPQGLRQLLSGAWDASPCCHLFGKAGFEDALLISWRSPDGHGSTLSLCRKEGNPRFGNREAQIAHFLLSEIPWIHAGTGTGDLGKPIASLSPRLRITLTHLIRGLIRREIARNLSISMHTTAEYVQRIYRSFGVHSQPELISRFRSGSGK